MRAGAVSAAALTAPGPTPPSPVPQHCSEEIYHRFVEALPVRRRYRGHLRARRQRFVERWPKIHIWFTAPLSLRVGRLPSRRQTRITDRVCYQAREYLLFLALQGYIRLDYAWLLGAGHLYPERLAVYLGIDLGIETLAADAVRLGFSRIATLGAMRWCVGRIVLHTGLLDATQFGAEHIEQLREAIRRFAERPDLAEFYQSPERYRVSPSKNWITSVYHLQTVLYHRGQIAHAPRKVPPPGMPRPPLPPKMQRVVDRWLATRRLTDRAGTLSGLELALHRFSSWMLAQAPEITSFAQVEREHVLRYLHVLTTDPLPSTGRPMALSTRSGYTSALAGFFRQTAAWGFDDVPGQPLIGPGDSPRRLHRVPRFIPDDELARLMTAINALDCPYQRAALLIARWSGARRGEIRRLALDCLDAYPDGTPRLRLPVGKTRRERMVPLHDDAAVALREVLTLRMGRGERTLTDEVSGSPTYYLFMDHGKLLSDHYLFTTSLRRACQSASLVDAQGRATMTPHRFRHTVGTQLAERGAKLHTIMRILGHTSASMALVYAQISDPEVLRDYQSVLGPGATLAGPAAEALRSGAFDASTLEWLKTNFFKTEMELGHCLRLPAEGPCECDLYLTCAKFVTTAAYAPRLRRRHQVELVLAADAEAKGWGREVERHRATDTRLERLLAELGEPLEGPIADGPTPSSNPE